MTTSCEPTRLYSSESLYSDGQIPRDSVTTLIPSRIALQSSRPRQHPITRFFHRLVSLKPISAEFDRGDAEQAISLTTGTYRRSLNAFDLTLIGIGGIIGAGIFVLTGRAASEYAGPGLMISFVFAGVVSALASFCYAELAALIPVAGSAYTYAYTTLGELVAWIIGWDLLLEYLVGAATVAVGWSGYFASFISSLTGDKYILDPRWSSSTITWNEASVSDNGTSTSAGFALNRVPCGADECLAYFNAPAVAIVAVLTAILATGAKSTSVTNSVFVIVKIVVIFLFIGFGIPYINTENYSPFIPPNTTGVWGQYGWSGVLQASTLVFFAYIGFDAVSTTAQEAKNPQRDLPVGIIGSLVICTALYLAVTAVLTGVVKYTDINVLAPVASAIPIWWLKIAIEAGAIAGLTSVLLVTLLGQTRVLQSMASDGLLPSRMARLDRNTGVPVVSILTTGSVCAVLAGALPIDVLGNMTSVGTLFAFAIVCTAVPVLRYTRPNAERKFKVPGGRIVGGVIIPVLGAVCSIGLIAVGTLTSIIRLAVWMGIGLVIYFCYGFWFSRVGRRDAVAELQREEQQQQKINAKEEDLA